MNSLIFNTTAEELRTSVYGYNQDTEELQLLQLNASGELRVAGDLEISSSVTIANTLLTVTGSVTLANTLLTVGGSITITNTSLNVFMEGNLFTANTETLSGVTSTGIALEATDISELRTATMFVNNTDDNPITVTLQLSPDGTTYFNDPNYTDVVVEGTSSEIIVVGIFAHYAQLEYDAGALATFSVYYNGQA